MTNAECGMTSVPFFTEDAAVNRLQASARLWLRTPFHAHACIRGAGVDCVHLCAAIYIECGVMEQFNPPRYTLDGGKHAPASLIMAWLATSPQFVCLGTTVAVMPGDLVCFAFGAGRAWHVGMVLDQAKGEFVHALADIGVVISLLHEQPWAHRTAAFYRPMKS